MASDLFLQPSAQEPVLTASPEVQSSPASHLDDEGPFNAGALEGASAQEASSGFGVLHDGEDYTMVDAENPMEVQLSDKFRAGDKLHPHVQVLSISDLEACVALENATMKEAERCSQEKFIYRLTACPQLCLGLFSSISEGAREDVQAFHDVARAPDSTNPSHKSVLLGHVIGTLTSAPAVTDASMQVAESFSSEKYQEGHANGSTANAAAPTSAPSVNIEPPPVTPNDPLPSESGKSQVESTQTDDIPGHHAHGRTLAIHSVCILPQYQSLGLGKVLMKSYLQRMEGSGIANRAALLAHPDKVGWYVGCFSFKDEGESAAKFGGGGWRDLTYEFSDSSLWA